MSGLCVRASIGGPSARRLAKAGPRTETPSQGARALALAHYVDQALEEGHYASASEVAKVLGVTRARISQVMSLMLLPPTVQEKVLIGKWCVAPRSLRWQARRAVWRGAIAAPLQADERLAPGA